MAKKSFPLSKVYGLLEPGPVVLVTTARDGNPNIMTMSWHTMMEFEPPIVGCVISNRDYTFSILKQTKECVINIPTVELAAKVVGSGNTSGRDVDKFEITNSCILYKRALQDTLAMAQFRLRLEVGRESPRIFNVASGCAPPGAPDGSRLAELRLGK